MNAERRKQIAKARELVEQAQAIIEEAGADERDYFDNMPESLQGSDRGLEVEAVADRLDSLADELGALDFDVEAM